MKNSVHYKAGSKNEIAVILSCPGKDEASANPPEPAKGQTGKNLEIILGILTKDYGHSGFTRDEICITNAWDQVEYSNGTDNTGRSEATVTEILNSKNLDRLATKINNIEKVIICCGVKAKSAVKALSSAKKLHSNVKVISLPHFGNKSLNRTINKTIDDSKIETAKGNKSKNRLLRLQVVAKKLHDQITK